MPARPVQRITTPLERFLHFEAAGGVVLLLATVFALAAANSGWAAEYRTLWETPASLGIGGFELSYPLWYWINDGLMAIFFFVIGLEVKRELVWGELKDFRNVILPAAGALGGVVIPVTLYLSLQNDAPGRDGWAVPMATDIAFVVGCLALFGSRVPSGLKIFMLSLAIIDDILAVLVIAVFFSGTLSLIWMGGAAVGFAMVVSLHWVGVRRVGIYVFVGVGIWLCTLKSGIHPTVAGVLLGLLTPATAWLGSDTLIDVIRSSVRRIDPSTGREPDSESREAADELAFAATESVAPLDRLERLLHPWVSFVIVPIFALANAGVTVKAEGLGHPIALAVVVGLTVGKPLGIFGASWIVVRSKLAALPHETSWVMLLGASCLGGIGFTMALFIASLSLPPEVLDVAKTGILTGSAVSLVLGIGLLAVALFRAGSRQTTSSTIR